MAEVAMKTIFLFIRRNRVMADCISQPIAPYAYYLTIYDDYVYLRITDDYVGLTAQSIAEFMREEGKWIEI